MKAKHPSSFETRDKNRKCNWPIKNPQHHSELPIVIHGSDGLGDPKPENPTGKPDILGHPNPTRTRGVYTQTRPETRHSKPENPRYFQGIQNIEILTKKVVIFV